jgi:hypothetical protein
MRGCTYSLSVGIRRVCACKDPASPLARARVCHNEGCVPYVRDPASVCFTSSKSCMCGREVRFFWGGADTCLRLGVAWSYVARPPQFMRSPRFATTLCPSAGPFLGSSPVNHGVPAFKSGAIQAFYSAVVAGPPRCDHARRQVRLLCPAGERTSPSATG